jgi:hypothetical protein
LSLKMIATDQSKQLNSIEKHTDYSKRIKELTEKLEFAKEKNKQL